LRQTVLFDKMERGSVWIESRLRTHAEVFSLDLFDTQRAAMAPLADRMRPESLDDFIGQAHLLASGKLLRRAIVAGKLTSSIFFGPPGCGKTTLAHIIAKTGGAHFVKMNAVSTGVAEVRTVLEQAENRLRTAGRRTYLLLDECHRWSKAQADCILPAMENGIIAFIGSTTENPTIAMTPALISRCRLFHFEALSAPDVGIALDRALMDQTNGLGAMPIDLDADARAHLAHVANGDIRNALNALELAVLSTPYSAEGRIHIDLNAAAESIQQRVLAVDESYYYDMLSAFCKSLRGSDSNAAIAWAMRLLHAGVDPHIIARRLIAHASEDIGLAEPQAMVQAVAAAQAVALIGLPEARLSLTQAIIFLCEAPKSNSVVGAIGGADHDIAHTQTAPVPRHLQDSHYKGHTKLGAGEGYLYPHDYPGHFVEQEYMPKGLDKAQYYRPSDEGYERKIREQRRARGIVDEE